MRSSPVKPCCHEVPAAASSSENLCAPLSCLINSKIFSRPFNGDRDSFT